MSDTLRMKGEVISAWLYSPESLECLEITLGARELRHPPTGVTARTMKRHIWCWKITWRCFPLLATFWTEQSHVRFSRHTLTMGRAVVKRLTDSR